MSKLADRAARQKYQNVRAYAKLDKLLRHLTASSLVFYRDQKVHDFDAMFSTDHLYVSVVQNCSNLSKIKNKKIRSTDNCPVSVPNSVQFMQST